MMKVVFKTRAQCAIADLMWACQTTEDVQAVRRVFGLDGEVVYNMLVAQAFDEMLEEQQEFPEVFEMLESLK